MVTLHSASAREQAAQREIPSLVQDLGRGRGGVGRALSELTQKLDFDEWSMSCSLRSLIE